MVRLPKINNDDKSTYINANFVRSYGGRRAREYIAAQGPLPATVQTFVCVIPALLPTACTAAASYRLLPTACAAAP